MREAHTVNHEPEDGRTAEAFCTFPLFGNEAIAYRVPEGKDGDTAYTDERILECAGLFLAEKPFLTEKPFLAEKLFLAEKPFLAEKKKEAPCMTVVRDSFGKPHIRLLPESPEGREGTEAAEAADTAETEETAETAETEETEELYVSVTHTKGLALIAVSPFPIGIDAEREEKTVRRPEALARRYFTKEDAGALEKEDFSDKAFLTMWVKKEALSKLIGRGVPCMREKSVFGKELVFERLGIPGYTVFAVRAVNDTN